MNRKKINQRRQRRAFRVRKSLREKSMQPRVSVFRSHKNMYAQLIDDAQEKTIVASSSLTLNLVDNKKEKLNKTAVAHAIGVDLAKKAIQANVTTACFDRGSYLYHGRVKALVEGLRAGGLKI